jgi:hypothetical protein
MDDKQMLTQGELLCPHEELALAKQAPNGVYLSAAAQALYEAEGRARFLSAHRRAAAALGKEQSQ